MDDEIEDVVGEVKLTDSQKSVAMSNAYSMDFTDSSSERPNSSGMDTYVLESWDSEDSESSPLHNNVSVSTMKDRPLRPVLMNTDAQCEITKKTSKACSTSFLHGAIISQEIFTQTSKTIIELAESEGARRPVSSKNLETQTSFISITENKTVEYRIEMSGGVKNYTRSEITNESGDSNQCNMLFPDSLDDNTSKFMKSSEATDEKSDDTISVKSSEEKIINILNDESKENMTSDQNYYENTSEFEGTDMEDDSLMEPNSKVTSKNDDNRSESSTKSVDKEVAELYNKLYETMEFQRHQNPHGDYDKKRFGQLTPLSEEVIAKKDSAPDLPDDTKSNEDDSDVLFVNNAGIKVKLFPKSEASKETEGFKLPPIQGNHGPPDNANLNYLFAGAHNKNKSLPCVLEDRRDRDRWDIGSKDLGAGESPLISGRSDLDRSPGLVQLPPIHGEGFMANLAKNEHKESISSRSEGPKTESQCSINIKDKIKELKMSHKPRALWNHAKFQTSESRSCSPSTCSPDESRIVDAAERGCELLCVDLLKRLRSHSWFEIADALDDVPRVLDKFWGVITENRVADLIRTVIAHVESPRTQVARAACNTLAVIVKNTNYTKKPDFYEAVTVLLTKTGSFSRPVRRAANVALDEIVCGVDLSHAVTALCIHGTSHKSALVRCASARLLVVCCALGGGGRELLRARPPTAANARRHALRALAALLDDKSTDARKYAERLYSMLRPLSNFEAYYLTDVDVETASKQMKKYDQTLLCGPSESR